MDRKHHCRSAEHETGRYHFLCNVRKCCGGDDRDAGKFRRYSFDFTIVNVQSGIETGMDITKNWLLKKVSFFVMYKKRKRKMGNGKFYDSFT